MIRACSCRATCTKKLAQRQAGRNARSGRRYTGLRPVQPRSRQFGTARLNDRGVNEHERKDDHDYARSPCDEVETPTISVVSHQVAAVDEEQDKDQDDWQPDTVGDLGEDQNFEERRARQKNDASANDDESSVERIERRRFLDLAVEAGFETKPFADHVRSG